MEIQLKHGLVAKVDTEIFPFFSSLKWISMIQIKGNLQYLGVFCSEEQARDAYEKAKEAL